MNAKTIMIQGTGSGVGKSLIVAALCRIFVRDGFKVAPYKAQNMALNSFVTKEGGEIGRAQATQAEAAKIQATVDMNPVLMKPSTDTQAQIIVLGKPIGNKSAVGYSNFKKTLFKVVLKSLKKLRKEYEVVVLEGAGSPAEVNLRKNDIVNMSIALASKSPVLLVGDIDKGGVLAWISGTLDLLTSSERKQVKGIIINKFRGDIRLFHDGIRFLEKRTGIPVLGVLPYMKDLRLPEEDSVPEKEREPGVKQNDSLEIRIVYLPHLSNFTDFDPLKYEPDVSLKFVNRKEEMGTPDILILPGTKNTLGDLEWLRKTGIEARIKELTKNGKTTLIGICGGYQMLGEVITDPDCIESKRGGAKGLGFLKIKTELKKKKTLRQIKARHIATGIEVKGYEIHHGESMPTAQTSPLFAFEDKTFDGTSAKSGRIWGTYLHGLFDNDRFRREFLNRKRAEKGLSPLKENRFDTNGEFDKLADMVSDHLDIKKIYRIMGFENGK